ARNRDDLGGARPLRAADQEGQGAQSDRAGRGSRASAAAHDRIAARPSRTDPLDAGCQVDWHSFGHSILIEGRKRRTDRRFVMSNRLEGLTCGLLWTKVDLCQYVLPEECKLVFCRVGEEPIHSRVACQTILETI